MKYTNSVGSLLVTSLFADGTYIILNRPGLANPRWNRLLAGGGLAGGGSGRVQGVYVEKKITGQQKT
jgi:hypothetical protein